MIHTTTHKLAQEILDRWRENEEVEVINANGRELDDQVLQQWLEDPEIELAGEQNGPFIHYWKNGKSEAPADWTIRNPNLQTIDDAPSDHHPYESVRDQEED